MRIYGVRSNVQDYQYFLPVDPEVFKRREWTFDCERREATWQALEVYVYRPKLKRGNFIGLGMGGGALVCDEATLDRGSMRAFFEMSGELLPFMHEGQRFYVVNVMECVNALDRDNAIWSPEMKQKVGAPKRYAFHPNRLPETPLFKIPETSIGEVLCVENSRNRDLEFKAEYERLGLTGLSFVMLWSNES